MPQKIKLYNWNYVKKELLFYQIEFEPYGKLVWMLLMSLHCPQSVRTKVAMVVSNNTHTHSWTSHLFSADAALGLCECVCEMNHYSIKVYHISADS